MAAGGVFSAIAITRGLPRMGNRDLLFCCAAGLTGICLNQVAFVYALYHASAGTVSLILGFIPIFVSVLAQASGHETLARRQWIAVTVSSAGVATVVLGAATNFSADVIGIACALGMAVTWALYSVAAASLVQRHSVMHVSGIACALGTVPLLAISANALRAEPWATLSLLTWGTLVYGAVIANVLAFALWLLAIKRIGASRVATYQNLQPFLGAIFAVLVLEERLTLLQYLGGAIIAAGIALVSWPKRRSTPHCSERGVVGANAGRAARHPPLANLRRVRERDLRVHRDFPQPPAEPLEPPHPETYRDVN